MRKGIRVEQGSLVLAQNHGPTLISLASGPYLFFFFYIVFLFHFYLMKILCEYSLNFFFNKLKTFEKILVDYKLNFKDGKTKLDYSNK